MLESFYLTGWGAFGMLLFMLLPFAFVFLYVVFKKTYVDSSPSKADRSKFVRVERMWIGFAAVVFIVVNVASLEYMPSVYTAKALASGEKITEVSFTAESWSYDLPETKIEVGRPIRFSGKSNDTMHGFALYHPKGKVLFTMMLMPGLENPTSIIYTFKDPGTYIVRCLEYCGLAHHEMRDEIVVVASSN